MDDIVDRLTTLFWAMKDAGRLQDKNTVADAIADIEMLRCQMERLRYQMESLDAALDDISHLTRDHQVLHRIEEARRD
jgi:prefoldin subunit 5